MNRRKEIVERYEAQRNVDGILQDCMACGQRLYHRTMHRHHPAGRHGSNVLKYIYLCPQCHDECHQEPKVATRRGLLWPGRNVKEITDEEWADLLLKIKENQYKL